MGDVIVIQTDGYSCWRRWPGTIRGAVESARVTLALTNRTTRRLSSEGINVLDTGQWPTLLFAVGDWFFLWKTSLGTKWQKACKTNGHLKNKRNMLTWTWDSKIQGERFSTKNKLPVRDTSKTLLTVNRHLRQTVLSRKYYTVDIHRNRHFNLREMTPETILNMFWTKTSEFSIKQLLT